MVQAFIGLGSNLEDPVAQLNSALNELRRLPHTEVIKVSSFYRTAPVGYEEQPDFVNAVARIQTRLDPKTLLDGLLDIEHRHGRVRTFRNAPRILDLDLLLFGELCMEEAGLVLPHPRMHERAFVLYPLFEIAPEFSIQGKGRVSELLAACPPQEIEKLPFVGNEQGNAVPQ